MFGDDIVAGCACVCMIAAVCCYVRGVIGVGVVGVGCGIGGVVVVGV